MKAMDCSVLARQPAGKYEAAGYNREFLVAT